MSELADLYQDVILDHGTKPRHFSKLCDHTHSAHGHNPLCGDDITIYLNVLDKHIEQASFQGQGCAICIASASLMCDHIQGCKLEQAQTDIKKFQQLATSEQQVDLGKCNIFAGVRAFPMRVKCATLAWHTLSHALDATSSTATTEN